MVTQTWFVVNGLRHANTPPWSFNLPNKVILHQRQSVRYWQAWSESIPLFTRRWNSTVCLHETNDPDWFRCHVIALGQSLPPFHPLLFSPALSQYPQEAYPCHPAAQVHFCHRILSYTVDMNILICNSSYRYTLSITSYIYLYLYIVV